MNLKRYLNRFKAVLQMQKAYLELRHVEKIKKSAKLVESLSEKMNLIINSNSTPTLDLGLEDIQVFNEVKHLYEVNKSLLYTYRDLSNQTLKEIKKDKLTYARDGRTHTSRGVLYSTTA